MDQTFQTNKSFTGDYFAVTFAFDVIRYTFEISFSVDSSGSKPLI